MNIKTENWNGHEIRFVEREDGEWWAIAKDVSDALGYQNSPLMTRRLDKDEKNTIRLTHSNRRGNPNVTIISEIGIYEAIFGSELSEAKEFRKWVKDTIKQLRQATGLEGFQIFRMMDKEHQKEAMRKLRDSLRRPVRVDFIKANTIANKAVSSMYGHRKMLKKGNMSPSMLVDREPILDDTVELMSVADKFGLPIKVSDAIYKKYVN